MARFWAILGILGRFGSVLGPLGGVSGASWGVLGASWGPLGASWGPLGASRGRLRGVLGRLGGLWGASGFPRDSPGLPGTPPGRPRDPPGTPSGPLGAPKMEDFHPISEPFWTEICWLFGSDFVCYLAARLRRRAAQEPPRYPSKLHTCTHFFSRVRSFCSRDRPGLTRPPPAPIRIRIPPRPLRSYSRSPRSSPSPASGVPRTAPKTTEHVFGK